MSPVACVVVLALVMSTAGSMWEADMAGAERLHVPTPEGSVPVTGATGTFRAGYYIEGNGTVDYVEGGVYIRANLQGDGLSLIVDTLRLRFSGNIAYGEGRGDGVSYWGVREISLRVEGAIHAWGYYIPENETLPVDVNVTFHSSVNLSFTPALPAQPTFLGVGGVEVSCRYDLTLDADGTAIVYGVNTLSEGGTRSLQGTVDRMVTFSRDGDIFLVPNYVLGTAYIPLHAVVLNDTTPFLLLSEVFRTVEWRGEPRPVQVEMGEDPLSLGVEPEWHAADRDEVLRFLRDMDGYYVNGTDFVLQAMATGLAVLLSAFLLRKLLTRERPSPR